MAGASTDSDEHDGEEADKVTVTLSKEAMHGRLTDLMARAKDAGALSLTIPTEQIK